MFAQETDEKRALLDLEQALTILAQRGEGVVIGGEQRVATRPVEHLGELRVGDRPRQGRQIGGSRHRLRDGIAVGLGRGRGFVGIGVAGRQSETGGKGDERESAHGCLQHDVTPAQVSRSMAAATSWVCGSTRYTYPSE